MTNLARMLIFAGVVLIVAGTIMYIMARFTIPLGRLPGDIIIKKEHFSFYFPVTTCIIISGILTLLFYLFKR